MGDALRLAPTADAIATHRQAGRVQILRGFRSEDSWPLATALTAHNAINGGVIVYNGGRTMRSVGRDGNDLDDGTSLNWQTFNPMATYESTTVHAALCEVAAPFHTIVAVPSSIVNLAMVKNVIDDTLVLRNGNRLAHPSLIVLLDIKRPDVHELDKACSALFSCISIGPFRAVAERDWDQTVEQILEPMRCYFRDCLAVNVQGLFPEESWLLAQHLNGKELVGTDMRATAQELREIERKARIWLEKNLKEVAACAATPSDSDADRSLICRPILFSEREGVLSLGKMDGVHDTHSVDWQLRTPLVTTSRSFLHKALSDHTQTINLVIVVARSSLEIINAVTTVRAIEKLRAAASPHPVPIKVVVVSDPDDPKTNPFGTTLRCLYEGARFAHIPISY